MNAFKNRRVAVIGAGNVGMMLLERMRVMGVPANMMAVCDSNIERAQTAATPVGACVFDLADPSICDASVWLLSTGPKVVLPVLKNLTRWLKPGHIVVSFAAGVPLAILETNVPQGVSVARIMPNMPSLVGRGMNPVSFGEKISPDARTLVFELLDAMGKSIEVRDDQMNWCVGLSGAVMRSVLPAIEGMIRAGIEAGFSEADSRMIAAQTVMGTAGLVKHSTLSMEEIKNLTPMETLDETLVERQFYEAALGAKEKIDRLQEKIVHE